MNFWQSVIVIILLLLIGPLLGTLLGAFVGFMVYLTLGSWVVAGAHALGFTFVVADLPWIGAFFGFISGFIKASQTNYNKEDK